ncbi:MAG: DUF2207 domain-containing protein [Patescibacteria group bacterium]
MLKKILLFFGLAILIFPIFTHAQSNEKITRFSSTIAIQSDSSIIVSEEIDYFFPSPKHGIIRFIPFRYLDNTSGRYFSTPIQVLAVTNSQGKNWLYSQSQSKNYLELKIGDPNSTIEGNQTYKISYKVLGVINYFNDHDELYWNVTGDKWEVELNNIQAEVSIPLLTNVNNLELACYTGSSGSNLKDCVSDQAGGKATFSSSKGPLTIVTGFEKGLVIPYNRQYEIKLRHESPWYWLIPLVVLIYLIFRYFLFGRDPFGRGTIAPEFSPPENLLPAEMGTLLDEKADRRDISATIIDLAVKGYLKIREKDKKYTLIKLKEDGKDLKNFEKNIFSGLFLSGKTVKLSEIHEDFAAKLSDIFDNLYQNLIEKKYFPKNPQKVRNKQLWFGFIVIILSGLFFWLSWNLMTALILSGVLILIFSRSMPKKTREGVIVKDKILGFKEFLYRAERYRIHWQEKENIFEKYLPYAMVLGIADKWAKNFKDIYKNPPDWYEDDFTTFNAVVFASSLNSFSTSASASFSPPSTSASSGGSGFGGGGSSGGGFGGGGGGSW